MNNLIFYFVCSTVVGAIILVSLVFVCPVIVECIQNAAEKRRKQ